jgi:glycosyltransferase 2 family protein
MVAVVAAVVIKVGVDNTSSLRHIHLRIEAVWLAPLFAASLGAGVLMPLGWRRLLAAYGYRLPVRACLRVWWTAQITRYVPTGAAALATRVALAAKEGVPRLLAGASLPVEVAVIVGWGTVLTGVLLPSSVLGTSWRILVVLVGAGGLAGLPALLRLAPRIVPRLPSPLTGRAGTEEIYSAEAYYALNSALRTASFIFLCAAILPVRWGDVALIAGALNAGGVAGLVSIAPGGLGVREGVLALVLRHRFGFGDAAAAAVALRASDLVVDVVWLAIARITGRRRLTSAVSAGSDVVEVAPGQ